MEVMKIIRNQNQFIYLYLYNFIIIIIKKSSFVHLFYMYVSILNLFVLNIFRNFFLIILIIIIKFIKLNIYISKNITVLFPF